jgi:Rho termination factor, N-terminal domain
MDFSKRQKQIIDRLRPKPIHHGQLETSQIAVPNLKSEDIAPERWQVLRDSLEQEGSNLVPLIVRRTEAYEEEEYEVVYGADWCLVAKELEIERLWVWVFDLTDEQAISTKEEMEQLLGTSDSPSPPPDQIKQIGSLLQRLEISLAKSFQQQITELLERQISEIVEKQISESIQGIEDVLITRLDAIQKEFVSVSKPSVYRGQDNDYDSMNKSELQVIAKQRGLKKYSSLKKADLINLLQQSEAE